MTGTAYLFVARQAVDQLLDRAGTVHVEGDVDKPTRHVAGNVCLLVLGAVAKEFLAEVVSKRICAQIVVLGAKNKFKKMALPLISSAMYSKASS